MIVCREWSFLLIMIRLNSPKLMAGSVPSLEYLFVVGGWHLGLLIQWCTSSADALRLVSYNESPLFPEDTHGDSRRKHTQS